VQQKKAVLEFIAFIHRKGKYFMKIDNSFFESNRIGPASALIQTPETGKENTNAGFAGGFENIFNELWEASSDLSAASRAERAKLLTGTQTICPE